MTTAQLADEHRFIVIPSGAFACTVNGGQQSSPVSGALDPDLTKWDTEDRGYADFPVTNPLTELQIARQLPTLGIVLGDHRQHVRGKIREYVSLWARLPSETMIVLGANDGSAAQPRSRHPYSLLTRMGTSCSLRA